MIFTISLVVTKLYLILGEVPLKTSDKYWFKVVVLSLGLWVLDILFIIKSGTDRKYLLIDSGIFFN
jgi:hypothetical protein